MTALMETEFCDSCGYQLDAVTVVGNEDDLPQEDDVSVCMKCGALRFFAVKDGHISRRMPTPEEFEKLRADEGLQKLERVRALVTEGALDS